MKMINFFQGHPTNYLLPAKEILQASTSLLTRERPGDARDEDRHPLTYGSDPGSKEVRTAIAKWATKTLHEEAYGQVDP